MTRKGAHPLSALGDGMLDSMPEKGRSPLRPVLLALLLLVLAAAPALADYKAVAADGDVSIILPGKTAKSPLRAGTTIPDGSTIVTGEDGQCVLQWDDTFNLVEILPRTKARVQGRKVVVLD